MKKYLSLLFIAAMLSLSGCASFFSSPDCVDRGDGFCWRAEAVQIPVEKFSWTVENAETASTKCGYGKPFEHATCVMARNREQKSCDIVSALTPAQAHGIQVNSPLADFKPKSLYCHELDDHCGFNVCGTNPTRIQWRHESGPVIPFLARH